MKSILIFSVLTCALVTSAVADDILIEIKEIRPERVEISGFVLDRDQKVKIEATGFLAEGRNRHQVFLSSAWLLNSETREIVWEMEGNYSSRRRHSRLEVNQEIELPKGRYELYYSSFPHYDNWDNVDNLGDLIHVVFDGIFDRNHWEDEYRDFKIVVTGEGKPMDRDAVYEWHEQFNEKAIVSLTSLRNDRFERQGFVLDRPMDVRVYAHGEITRDGNFDYGWIINADTRERVWKMTYRDTEHAGGAEKNRYAERVLSLPAGNYAVIFITDDSHSYRRWNSAPPYDPLYWGITITPEDPDMARHARLYDYEDKANENLIVALTRTRSDEHVSKGIVLERDMAVRIYAIGEGRDGDMFDYGWIEDAKTRRRVWRMRYRDTEHAGGSSKNRLFDDVVELDKGSYIVHFSTDDSHAYRDWNSSRPFDPDGWGIQLFAGEKGFKASDVSEYREEEDSGILARLDRMRDNQRRSERFTMNKDGDVHVYAVGEGTNGDMHDYGWIEEAESGDVVWEMTYRKTDHAGGARKNRLFDDTIFLREGDYRVFFRTDDSHSYRDWNSDAPDDRSRWGITLRKVD